ncbi:PIR protein [Plasmodium yoelii]|uniref:PIR protein n=2 Tax=Plasmodium yoelii TaxID=5861 RepID=A0AAF0B159_PLAYO|nr:PIR protein [Plasmodium yoelii]WBY56188.1 PIR protein [Plasmodium yoelii yoelii]CDU17369.1 YIR protein [Plasmodium yoelii]VTZ76131.1 PIR protein [Plasmodium yoelii]|eukprot:XP_034493446.1 PIR protein [Plasmodium yoelii]
MNKEVCKRFKNIWDTFPDELGDSGNYQFKDNNFSNNYCNNNNLSSDFCYNNFQSDFNRINAGCLYLLDELINDCGVVSPPEKNIINIVDYILIWLSYTLNLKKSEKDNITCFYKEYIYDCDKYKTKINEFTDYDDYIGLIDTKMGVLNMDSNTASKFYKAFKSLCEIYTEFDENTSNCTNYSETAKEFVKQYEELYKDDNITKDSSYSKVLCTLSNDYDNFKKKCNDNSSLPTIETEKISEICSEQTSKKTHVAGYEEWSGEISEDTSSSSSIASKLIPVLLIFAAIPIFLGISYKYSLFGFRKRSQKQYLREKIKNIKKKMNH